MALLVGFLLMGIDALRPGLASGWAAMLLESVDLGEAFLHGLLGFMLFAASLHVDIGRLWQWRWMVLVLSTAGVTARPP